MECDQIFTLEIAWEKKETTYKMVTYVNHAWGMKYVRKKEKTLWFNISILLLFLFIPPSPLSGFYIRTFFFFFCLMVQRAVHVSSRDSGWHRYDHWSKLGEKRFFQFFRGKISLLRMHTAHLDLRVRSLTGSMILRSVVRIHTDNAKQVLQWKKGLKCCWSEMKTIHITEEWYRWKHMRGLWITASFPKVGHEIIANVVRMAYLFKYNDHWLVG